MRAACLASLSLAPVGAVVAADAPGPADQMAAAVNGRDEGALLKVAPLGPARIVNRASVPITFAEMFAAIDGCTLASVDNTTNEFSAGSARWACSGESSEMPCFDKGYRIRLNRGAAGVSLLLSDGGQYSTARCGPLKIARTPPPPASGAGQ